MSSSISNSEKADDTAYRIWVVRFCTTLLCGLAATYVAVVLCDPYSTGRLTPIAGIDIAISNRALANAGRARDQRFDSAIIANSHGLALDPGRLSVLTGLQIVHLGVLSVGPKEELAIASAFMRAHEGGARALVWIVDDGWCVREGEAFPQAYDRFPFWLYQTDDLAYLAHIFSIDTLQASIHRLAIRWFNAPSWTHDGRSAAPTSADNAEFVAARARLAVDAPVRGLVKGESAGPHSQAGTYPMADRLVSFIGGLAPQTTVLLVFMPYHASVLPKGGSAIEGAIIGCKDRFRKAAFSRPSTFLIDYLRDDEIAHDAANFNDPTHVSSAFARTVETDLATTILGAKREGR